MEILFFIIAQTLLNRGYEKMADVWEKQLWAEACRLRPLAELAQAAFSILAESYPVRRITLRRWEAESQSLVTVAEATAAAGNQGNPIGQEKSRLAKRQVAEWERRCRSASQTPLHSGSRPQSLMKVLVPTDTSDPWVAFPLVDEDSIEGLVIVEWQSRRSLSATTRKNLLPLAAPLSLAMVNCRRLQELTTHQQAAEADRRALLQRLGRSSQSDEIIGSGSGLKAVMQRVALVASSDVPVLVLGETGTGKEVVARALHQQSQRPDGPFIRVNCGAIPTDLIDSQLFGHEKGSFTGAQETRQGWFERADGGTLFLDEVGELPKDAQVRLLRVLQDGFVERVGATSAMHVDVRVIAATHRDLAAMVNEGTFREDLWYRLAVFPMLVPPLRERRGDIPGLVQHFAEKASRRFGLPIAKATAKDLQLLRKYHWPGNVRELAAVIDRAAILGEGRQLDIATALGWPVQRSENERSKLQGSEKIRGDRKNRSPNFSQSPGIDFSLLPSLEQMAKCHILDALTETQGRIEGPHGAAKLLQINPNTLRSRMKKLGIKRLDYRKNHGSAND